MACVNDKGQLTESAKKILNAVSGDPVTPQEISKKIDMPLFKVRSSLREMLEIEFISEENGKYQITQKAIEALEKNK